jgi:hypothetical protein
VSIAVATILAAACGAIGVSAQSGTPVAREYADVTGVRPA